MAPFAATSISRSPSIGLRENRVASSTHTPSDAPDSSRSISRSQFLRITFGFHADRDGSVNTSPTCAPRSSMLRSKLDLVVNLDRGPIHGTADPNAYCSRCGSTDVRV